MPQLIIGGSSTQDENAARLAEREALLSSPAIKAERRLLNWFNSDSLRTANDETQELQLRNENHQRRARAGVVNPSNGINIHDSASNAAIAAASVATQGYAPGGVEELIAQKAYELEQEARRLAKRASNKLARQIAIANRVATTMLKRLGIVGLAWTFYEIAKLLPWDSLWQNLQIYPDTVAPVPVPVRIENHGTVTVTHAPVKNHDITTTTIKWPQAVRLSTINVTGNYRMPPGLVTIPVSPAWPLWRRNASPVILPIRNGVPISLPPLSHTAPEINFPRYVPDIPNTAFDISFGVDGSITFTRKVERPIPGVVPVSLAWENTLMHDTKSGSAMGYLFALNMVNQTWGKVSEVLDFKTALFKNIMVIGHEKYIHFNRDGSVYHYQMANSGMTRLSDIPLGMYPAIFSDIAYGHMDFNVNWIQFMADFALMQSTDWIRGQVSKLEASAINDMGIRGGTPLEVGNISSWLNRAQKATSLQP